VSGDDQQDDDPAPSSGAGVPPAVPYLDELLADSGQPAQGQAWRARWTANRARRKRRLELMSSEELATESRRHDLGLRKRVGTFAIVGVSAELIIANAVFVLYAWLGQHWKVPTGAINVWLGATVVQVVGILYVITNYLFPKSGTPLGRGE
jgi:hypothetical protein